MGGLLPAFTICGDDAANLNSPVVGADVCLNSSAKYSALPTNWTYDTVNFTGTAASFSVKADGDGAHVTCTPTGCVKS